MPPAGQDSYTTPWSTISRPGDDAFKKGNRAPSCANMFAIPKVIRGERLGPTRSSHDVE